MAVADYLYRCQESLGAETGIAVFLVALSVERVETAYIPRFTVLSRPNSWRAAVAAAEQGRFATMEDFLASCTEDVRAAADRILQTWTQQTLGSMRINTIGVSLDVCNPFKTQGRVTSVFVLDTKGQITVNRGYLIDGALIRDPTTADLDTQLRTLFPTARWGKAGYYLTAGAPPDPDAIQAFQAWLIAHIDELRSAR